MTNGQKWILAMVAAAGLVSAYPVMAESPATAPSTQAEIKDAGNTKCLVMPDDEAGDVFVIYKNVKYHLCCKSCVKAFNKNPEKYVKKFEEDPAKFGAKK